MDRIENGFANRWNFPNCIGAIDGKHVQIQCPSNSGSAYFNYKQTFSIVLLGLVDDDYNFTAVDIGRYGSCSDGGIFDRSNLKRALKEKKLNIPEGSVILGDEAFALTEYLMRPYPRCRVKTYEEKAYNYRHCRARRIVLAFGILSSRFRIYRRPINLNASTVCKVTRTTCALHNWIRKETRCSGGLIVTVDVEDTEAGVAIAG